MPEGSFRTDRARPDWHVLGAGAMGTLYAHRLAAAGARVSLLLRGREPGVEPHTLERDGRLSQREFSIDRPEAAAPIDRLLLTTKALDVDTALASVEHRLHADTRVLVMANGMGFAAGLPHAIPMFRGSSTDGAFRRGPRHTVHAGRGSTRVGLPGVAMPAPAWFTASWDRLDDCAWDTDIETTLWRKLAINCVINPLTAVYRCRNGELASARYLPSVRALCEEVAGACRAAGHGAAASNLPETTLDVIERTAANRSSMLEDVLGHRQTEIDFINGFLCRAPGVSASDLPLNELLVRAVKQGRELHEPLC